MILENLKRDSGVYTFKKYGHFVSIDKIGQDINSNYIARMKVDYPLYIKDDRIPSKIIRKIVKLHDIGYLVYSKDGDLIDYPTRDDCIATIQNRIKFWRDKLEQIVISSTSLSIARIPRYVNFWNPIHFIVSSLIDYESVDIETLQRSQPSRILRYVKLLENLNLIEKKDNKYTYSNLFSMQLDKFKGNEKIFKDWVVSNVIENRYKTIRDVFNIKHFVKVIQTENCYYIPSINADELLYRTLQSITRDYKRWYGNVTYLDVRYWLKDLMDVGLIFEEDEYYYGSGSAFKTMLDNKDILPDRIPPIVQVSRP